MALVDKEELLVALDAVGPALAGEEKVEQATSFGFQGGWVRAYDDELAISHPLSGLGKDFEGAVLAEGLHKILKKAKGQKVSLRRVKNELIVKAGRLVAGIPLVREVRMPSNPADSVEKWDDLPNDFAGALKFVLFATSTNMSLPSLTCVHVNTKSWTLETCDNFRAVRRTVKGAKCGLGSFLLPASAARCLLNYDPVAVSRSDGWVHFRTAGKSVFSARVYDLEYPDTSGFYSAIGEDEKAAQIKFPKSLHGVVERAMIFSKGESAAGEFVTFRIEKGKLELKASGVRGWSSEEVPIRYDGEPLEFAASADFLMDCLALGELECWVGDEVFLFSGDGWEHIISKYSSDSG